MKGHRSQFFRTLLLLLLACPLAALAVDDIAIYSGTRRVRSFGVTEFQTASQRTFLVVDHASHQFRLICLNGLGGHTDLTFTMNLDVTQPLFPAVNGSSRSFLLSSSVSASGDETYVRRFLSVTRPVNTPIASDNSQPLPRSLSYFGMNYALDIKTEETGTFTYERGLTVRCNDANADLNAATTLVLNDLLRRRLIK